jgi:phage major head subunit gpT-like protein
MTMLRTNFGDLLAPGMRKIFQNMYSLYPSGIEQIFNMATSKRQYETDSYVSGFGLIPKKTEGHAKTYDDIIQGLETEYTHDTYSLAYRITKEMWEDELYGAITRMPAALGRSMRITIETDGANQLNNAFNTAITGADGQELCDTGHVLLGGGTQKNELTASADLSMSSLEQAMVDIAETTDDRGLTLHLVPQKLIVPVELQWTAQKILRSDSDPNNANDQFNPAKGSLQLIVNHFLTDADAWFIECTEHYMYWFWRIKPDHQRDNDFDTDDAKFSTRARWSRGWSMPWGIFGSPGI